MGVILSCLSPALEGGASLILTLVSGSAVLKMWGSTVPWASWPIPDHPDPLETRALCSGVLVLLCFPSSVQIHTWIQKLGFTAWLLLALTARTEQVVNCNVPVWAVSKTWFSLSHCANQNKACSGVALDAHHSSLQEYGGVIVQTSSRVSERVQWAQAIPGGI